MFCAIEMIRRCSTYFPAADTQQELQDVALLLLLKLLDVCEMISVSWLDSACSIWFDWNGMGKSRSGDRVE